MAGLGLQLPESAKLPVSGARSDLPLVWQPSTKALVNFLNVEYAAISVQRSQIGVGLLSVVGDVRPAIDP